MRDFDARLRDCFVAAFPDLRESEIASATVDNTPSWDSMGGLTLAALIEEEFGVTFGDDVIWTLDSYSAIRAEIAKSMPVEAQPS